MISSFVWMAVFLSVPSQVPTVDAIRDAAAANRDHIESFVLKAHAIETERGEIPPDQDDNIINGTAEPFASLAPYATTRPALAQYQERRYQEARVIGQQNAIAVRERSKPAPIELVISCNFSTPILAKEITDKRDIAGIAQALGLGETATATLNKTHVEILTPDSLVYYWKEHKMGSKFSGGPQFRGLLNTDHEWMLWLGLLPLGFADGGDLSVSEDKSSGRITIHTTTRGVRKEYVVDPAINFRVVRYTLTHVPTGQVAEVFAASDYRPTQNGILIPFKTTLTRTIKGIVDAYSLDCVVDSFEVNPEIDRSIFTPPKDVRIHEMGKQTGCQDAVSSSGNKGATGEGSR